MSFQADPDAAVTAVVDAMMRGLRVAVVAKVESYDAAQQTASVTPQVRELVLVDGAPTYLPAQRVDGCPVVWPGGSTGGLTSGLTAGDLVIALVRDRSHDEVDNGNALPSEPQSSARCSLADIVVLPAYRVPGTMPSRGYRSDGAPVVWADGSLPVRIGTSTAAVALALATLTQARLDAIQTAFNSHVHGGVTTGAGVSAVPTPLIVGSNDVASARALVDS